MKESFFIKAMRKMFSPFIILFLMAFSLFAQDSRFYKILNTKSITIGITEDYSPLNFTKDGKRLGIEMNMIQSLANFLSIPNDKVKLVPVLPQDYVSSIQNNKVDILIAGVSRNLQRARSIWFSQPYITFTPGVLLDKNSLPQTEYGEFFEEKPYRTLWDLKNTGNLKLAAKKGSVYISLLREEFDNIEIVEVVSNEEGLKLLENREVSGFIHDSIYLDSFLSRNPRWKSRYKLLKGGPRKEVICVGLPFGDTILLEQINVWLQELQRTGQLKKWTDEYTGDRS